MTLPIALQAAEVSDTLLDKEDKVFSEGYGSSLFFKQPRTGCV